MYAINIYIYIWSDSFNIFMTHSWLKLACKVHAEYYAYEVRDLFPWKILTKMAISCLLSVEKIWNSAQINLSSIFNFHRKHVFDIAISTEKSTSEIDDDLAQNEMWLYLIPPRQLNLSYANEYTCHKVDNVKWHTNHTYIKFSSAFS